MSKHLAPPDNVDPETGAPRRRNWRQWFPFVFLGVMIVFSVGCGFIAVRMMQTKTNFVSATISFFVPRPQDVFSKERIYIALLGLDYDYNEKDFETSKDARTDKISIYGLDFPSKVVKEVAVPRDTDAVVVGHEQKINAAYHFGGVKLTDTVVGEFLQLPLNEKGTHFDRYVVLRINATKDFVDAIGGIDVPVEKEMNYDDSWGHLHIHFHPGLQHMNGEQAISYARFRHDECGDPCRIKRQQQVVRLAIAKLKSGGLSDITHIGSLIGVFRKNVDTNLTVGEMTSLGFYFRDMNMSDIHEQQIVYRDTKDTPWGGNVLIPDEKQKADLIADFLGPYVATTPAPHVAVATVAPSTVHVAVENGSGQSGLGSKMAEQLRKHGFVVDSVGNADAFTYDTTVIREHSKVPGVGELVRADLALKTAAVSPAPASSPSASRSTTAMKKPYAFDSAKSPAVADVTVVVGRDFAMALTVAGPSKGANSQ